MIAPPPNPFLNAQALSQEYASQVRRIANTAPILDGDAAFYKVDTRRPAHELEKGVCADAVNKRFEDGRAWPRYGVALQPWGQANFSANLFAGTLYAAGSNVAKVNITGFTVGHAYFYRRGNTVAESLFQSDDGGGNFSGEIAAGLFIATQTNYWLKCSSGVDKTSSAVVAGFAGKPVGFARFNDAQGFDCTVLATDDWRSAGGEDGGRGRLWRILPGNGPAAVPMNGHDVWDTSRLVACFNGLALLRHGDERHYFSAAAVGTNQITLNTQPNWISGDKVIYQAETNASITSTQTLAITNSDLTAETLTLASTSLLTTGRPATVTGITGASGIYYLRVVSGTTISLYDTADHAITGGATGRFNVTVNGQTGTLAYGAVPNPGASYYVSVISATVMKLYADASLTQPMIFNAAAGKFYLQRAADNPGFYGNVAPPLLARPNAAGNTWLDIGLKAVPTTIQITSTSTSAPTANLLTAPQHGLVPGDAVTVTGIHTTGPTLITGTVYAGPVSADTLFLYTTAVAALAAGSTGQIPLVTASETGTLTRAGATGSPLPGLREGIYFQNRLLGVNNADTLVGSDPLDPLHCNLFTSAVTANLGSSDPITALWPFGNDSVLVMRASRVDLWDNVSGGQATWTLTNITQEYGCIAPLSVAQTGNDVWFLSRKGVASITQTQNAAIQGVADPVSSPIKKYIDQIDWNHAPNAAGAYWNNRYFIAVPLTGQTGTVVNNGVLVYNFLNQGWEGLWQGTEISVLAFARQNVFGEERLTFSDANGLVNWFADGYADGVVPFADLLLTRAYIGDNPGRKIWLETNIIWDTNNPTLTVTAVTPGYNEEQVLVAGQTYDLTTYQLYGVAAYDPATSTQAQFDAPGRADYALTPQELLVGKLDVHQNVTEKYRLRRDDWAVQIRIENATGSVRIQAVGVKGVPGPMAGTRNT